MAHTYTPLISISPKIKQILVVVEMLAKTSTTVLIFGESGTGKELIARAIHKTGNDYAKPFVSINCGAIPTELFESELFGHEKGAFTGAYGKKIGKLEVACGGTIFLDEISCMPLNLQIKLLRFLEERTIYRLGSNRNKKINVRVIAATNEDLEIAVKNGKFREDLYYRLNVVPIHVPPLRERKEDIIILAKYFLKRFSQMYSKKLRKFSSKAIQTLCNYGWPGNVRQLKNTIERIVVFSIDDRPISYTDLPKEIVGYDSTPIPSCSLNEAIRAFERSFIISVLEKNRWNRLKAAQDMKIHRNTLCKKIRELDIRKV